VEPAASFDSIAQYRTEQHMCIKSQPDTHSWQPSKLTHRHTHTHTHTDIWMTCF